MLGSFPIRRTLSGLSTYEIIIIKKCFCCCKSQDRMLFACRPGAEFSFPVRRIESGLITDEIIEIKEHYE